MDTTLFRAVNDFARDTPWLHGFAQAYAGLLGPGLLAVLVLLGVAMARHRDATGLARAGWAGLAPLLAVALNQPLVHLFHRPRPFTALDHVLVLSHRSADGGMPSDHGTLAGATLAALFLVDRRLGCAATGAGVLLAVSRVYVGAHYPTDVLVGLAFGGLVALLGARLFVPLLAAAVTQVRRTPIGRVFTA